MHFIRLYLRWHDIPLYAWVPNCIIIHTRICWYLYMTLRSNRTYPLPWPFICPLIDDRWLLVTGTTVGYKRPFLQRVPRKHSYMYIIQLHTYVHHLSIDQAVMAIQIGAQRNASISRIKKENELWRTWRVYAYIYVRICMYI